MAEYLTAEDLEAAHANVATLGEVVNGDNQTMVESPSGEVYPSLANALYTVIQAGGFEPFQTQTALLASVPTVPKKAAYALDTGKVWFWNGSSWADTGLSALDQAKTDTALQVSTLKSTLNNLANYGGSGNIVPFFTDSTNKILLGYDTVNDKIAGAGLVDDAAVGTLTSETLGKKSLAQSNSSTIIPVLVDANNKILFGYDIVNDKLIGAFDLTTSGQQQVKSYKYFAQKPVIAEVNHVLSYGQSLSMGATATTILSTTQPYANTTFNTSPRKDTEATSVIPLVEQFNNPSIDGYTNRGETHCSGLANYASLAMLKENGANPANHVIFASTAGHGGYTIDQLKKGSSWYPTLLDHVNKAKTLNVGKTYKVQCIPWIQGENNAVSGGTQTSYATYKATLVQLQIDANTDIKAITSQTDDIRFITYQMSYAAATWPDIAKAQLDLARESDKFMLATPMYHFPYATDNIHLTNVGYKWMGAYFGRAYKQYVIDGRKPDFINPLYAVVSGSTIKIKFDVPTLPLQIDTTTLAATTSHGFKVVDGATPIAINSVTTANDTVILTLASAPVNSVQVRYALDYLGTGLTITGGASGNLRDSTPDTVLIAGVTKPLYHVCPHFELTAFLDKGI